MCSALKCPCRCLQGRPGICGYIQAVRTPSQPAHQPSTSQQPANPYLHTLWRELLGVYKGLFVRKGRVDIMRRKLRKRGQSKISSWRCALQREGRPEF